MLIDLTVVQILDDAIVEDLNRFLDVDRDAKMTCQTVARSTGEDGHGSV